MARQCAECKTSNEFAAKLHAENEELRKQLYEARAATVDANMQLGMALDNQYALKCGVEAVKDARPLTFDQVLALVSTLRGPKP